MKHITAGEAIPAGSLVASNEEGEAVNGEPVLIDPSGWEGTTDVDGTLRWQVVATPRALRTMSRRQLDDLGMALTCLRSAFTPDEPIGYEEQS